MEKESIMKFKPTNIIVLIVLLLVIFQVSPAFALQENPPAPTGIEYLVSVIFGLIVTVPGATALGTILVNLLKIPNWVTDTNAALWSNIINVAFALFIGFASLFTNWDIPGLDTKFSELSNTLAILLPVFVLLYKWLAPIFYGAIRGVPLLGYSHSLAIQSKKEGRRYI